MSHSNPYRPGCSRCGFMSIPEQCTKCNVAFYCSANCKELDASEHRPGCGAVARVRVHYEKRLSELTEEERDLVLSDPANMKFDGGSWIRRYPFDNFRYARLSLVNALQYVHTTRAAKERARLLRSELLLFGPISIRSGRCDSYEHNTKLAVGLSMRLGEDKACYQFMVQHNLSKWVVKGRGFDSYRDTFSLKTSNPDNVDVLDDGMYLSGVLDNGMYWSKAHEPEILDGPYRNGDKKIFLMAAALIKFRILQDLKVWPLAKGLLVSNVSKEVFDMLKSHTLLSDMSLDLLKSCQSQEEVNKTIETLRAQTDELFRAVETSVWQDFLRPDFVESDLPTVESFHRGLNKSIRVLLFDAFAETPGAEEYFNDLLDKQMLSSHSPRVPQDMMDYEDTTA